MKKRIKNALISVSDKSDLKKIVKILQKYKINIVSSASTPTEPNGNVVPLIIIKIFVLPMIGIAVEESQIS